MKLPIQISPTPLVGTNVEIRFDTNVERHKLLPLMLRAFYDDLPDLEESKFPIEFKNQHEQLKYFPDYTFSNDKFSIGFSSFAIAFDVIGDYPLWENYFIFIKDSIKKIFELNILSSINRIGLRYTSIIDKEIKIDDVLLNIPMIQLDDYLERFNSFQTSIEKNDILLYLQLDREKKIEIKGDELSGLIIDIDASYNNIEISLESYEPLCDKINNLHTCEKELFFSLLKPSFIESRTPNY